ncbi:hypothetical protein [Halobacillus faecis]|uniref:Uncharacterized protein n=1 Tax=Halobacillus faecis TaxID=360184 RepID=A0A511WVB9_9BACI|nr:hypothetical protein [Halobacillus faecis]GEN53272.1 hypothetical protein HFA01_15340 [Halobacillus faecis]
MEPRTTYSVYKWLRKKRWKKKIDLYQQTYNMVVDPVMVFYSGLFIIFCLFIGYDWLQQLLTVLDGRGGIIAPYALFLPLLAVISAAITSFTDPGIRFTSSEFQLSFLPHSRKTLVNYLFLEKYILQILIIIVVPLPFAFVLMSWESAVLWVSLLFLSYPLSLWLQWKLFSLPSIYKMSVILFSAIFSILFFFDYPVLLLYLGISVLFLLLFMRKEDLDWGRIIDINDARVWNMWLVGYFTEVKIKPPKRFGITKSIWKKKRGRHYSVQHLYGRIWTGYLQRSADVIWKTIPTVCLIILVIPMRVDWMLMFTLPIAIVVYHEVAGGLFSDVENVFHSMPFEEESCKTSYINWAYIGFFPVVICFFSIQMILGESFVAIGMQLIAIILFVYVDLAQVINERMMMVQKENFYREEWRRVAGLILLGAGVYHPLFLLGVPLVVFKPGRSIRKELIS